MIPTPEKIPGFHRNRDGSFIGNCPVCGGRETVWISSDGIVSCNSGCSTDEISATLTRIGNKATKPPIKRTSSLAVSQPAKENAKLRDWKGEANPFRRGLVSAADLPPGEPPSRLWFGLYPACVVLINGETGAGKSSFLYNLAIHAARNETLYGIPFGLNRPLNVLCVDPENAGSLEDNRGGLCALKMERINQGRPPALFFHDGRGVNLSNPVHIECLQTLITEKQTDILMLDPLANLFATGDENDNAEAAAQMKTLARLSRETNVCIIAVHHTGKGDMAGGNYGRGASARLAAADVGMVFRARGNGEDTDDDYNGETRERDEICRLQIVKNRLEGKSSLFLQMAGQDVFERVGFPEWQAASNRSGANKPKIDQARETIWSLLNDGAVHSRPDLIAALKDAGIGEKTADDALRNLCADGGVDCRVGERGAKFYRRQDKTSFAVPQPPKRLRNCETETRDAS